MNSTQIIQTWQAIPIQAQISRPQSELEFERLLELLDQITDQMAAKQQAVSQSNLRPLFDLVSTYIFDWEEANEAPILGEPREVLAQLLEEHQVSLKQLEREGVAKQSLLSAILSDKRQISKGLALKLAQRFKTSVAVFL